jgi:hypothetical protein
MEQHLERIATPARVRYAMKRHGLGEYDIEKMHGCWYVVGGDSILWPSTSLSTTTFAGSVAVWISAIFDLRMKYRSTLIGGR